MVEYNEHEAVVEAIMNQRLYYIFGDPNSNQGAYNMIKRVTLLDAVRRIPAADVIPIKHGKWIEEIDPWDRQRIGKCSECGQKYCDFMYFHFCPNCGANMREVINE